MAETVSAKNVTKLRGLTKQKYQAAIDQINRDKEKAKEANGVAAKATKDFCEQHGINPKALTIVAKLKAMEHQKRADLLRGIITGCDMMGYFDQIDMFDDTGTTIIAVAGRLQDKKGGGKGAAASTKAPAKADAEPVA